MWEEYDVNIDSILIANNKNTFVTNKIAETELDYGGIAGDLHFGLTKSAGAREPMYPRGTTIFNRRQITIVSVEECATIAEKLRIDFVLPEWLGANIALGGFPNLTQLREGSRILFPSGAGLLCEGENLPCIQPGEVIQQNYPDKPKLSNRFVKESMGLRGIVCLVEHTGKIVLVKLRKLLSTILQTVEVNIELRNRTRSN